MKRIFTLFFPLVFVSWFSSAQISVTGSLSALSTTYGTASSSTSFSFSANSIGNGEVVTVTPPAGFEVASGAGGPWSATLTRTANPSGNIGSTNVFVRLKADAPVSGSPYSGNVVLTGNAGAATKTIATASSTVNPKGLTITGATASNKTYDGTNSATVTASPTLNGVVGADVVTINAGATGTFAQSNIGTNIAVTSNYSLTGADAGNYTVTQPSLTANITALNLTITGASASNKVYDGTNSASVTASPTLNGVVAGDVGNVSINAGATGTFASSNVGTSIVVTSNYSLTGSAVGNYTLSQPSLTADITAISLTITGATASNKVYDGTTSATVTASPTLNGVLAGDVANVSIAGGATGTFASANVGTSISVTSNYSLTGSKAGNYTVTQPTLSADITAKSLTITGATASNKTYDGTNAATVTASPTLNGVIAGDVGNVSILAGATGTFASVNVGTGISVTSNYSLTGSAAGNYTVTQPTLSANITTKGLTITGASASNKVYDGTNSASVTASPTLNGVVAGDVGNVSINAGATGTFASSNVGTAIVVTSNYSLTGSAIGNYTLSQPSLTANITAISLTITGATASNKVYDGATSATVTASPTLNGVLAGDVANVSIAGGATGTFASANVGTSISVTSNYSLTGTKAGNYTVTQPTLSADITAKSLTITGATASNKVYDGTNAATVTSSPTLNGVIAGDVGNVSILAGATGTFASVNVGTGISVTSNYSLIGSKAGNYTVTQPTLTANITKKNLTITGVTANNKVYDGNTTGSLTGTPTLNGIVGADVVTVTGSPTATFASSATNQGQTGISVNVTGYTLGGAQAANYSVSQPTGLTATIYASEPGTQVKFITFSNTTAVSFDVSWTNGTGTNRLVLVNETGAVSATPTDFTSYTASADWNTKGSQIGTNNYVVYIGSGSTVSLNNLNVNTTYNVQIFEFNGAPGSGLENYNVNTDTNNPSSKKTNNVDTNSTFTAGGSPNATIASTVTTLGGEVGVFTFTATDIGGDFVSTRFTQLVFRQGAGNQVADWTQLIQGAELYDNATFGGTAGSPTYGKHLAAVIGATTITIPGISAQDGSDSNHPTDLGTIENSKTRIYTLKIYFKTSLGGTLPSTVDNKHLEFSISGADVTAVPIKSFFATGSTTSSGASNDAVSVTATKININQQPSTSVNAVVALPTQPIFEATDVNNNRDLDINNAITVNTSNPNNLSPASAPSNFVSGLANFTASGFNFQSTGTSTMNVSISSPNITSPNTNSITVTASTNLGASSAALASSPLSNGTANVAVLGFNLQTTGSPLTLTDINFTSSTSPVGLVSNFRLYSNSIDNFSGSTQVASSSSLNFTGMSISLSGAATYFFLVCDVDASFPSPNPSISFRLPAGNFTVSTGAKTGSTQNGPTYILQDLTPPVLQSITSMSSYINSWSTNFNMTTPQYNGNQAEFLMTFSEPVLNVTTSKITPIANTSGTTNYPGVSYTLSGVNPTDALGNAASTPSQYWKITYTGLTGTGYLYQSFLNSVGPLVIDVAGNIETHTSSSLCCTGSNYYYYLELPKPTNPVTTFALSGLTTTTSIPVLFSQPGGAQVATSYLIRGKESSLVFPTLNNGTRIPNDTDASDGFVSINIANTGYPAALPINLQNTFSGLKSGKSYTFEVYPYAYSPNDNFDEGIEYNKNTPATLVASTTVAASAYINPWNAASTVSSLINNQAQAHAQPVPNIQFQIYDELFDQDNAPTKFTGVVIKQGSGNAAALSDWTQAIAGAELTDGTTVVTASSITSNQIIFTGISSSSPGDLGYVADGTVPKTYSVNIWLKSSLGGTLPQTIDNKAFSFLVDQTSFTIDNTSSNQLSSTFQNSSYLTGASFNLVNVVASHLVLITDVPTSPAQIGVGHNFPIPPVIHAKDTNGNLDLDYNNAFTSTTSIPVSTSQTNFAGGILSLSNYNFSAAGTTTITISGNAGGIYPAFTGANQVVTSSITAVISTLTKITSGVAAPATISSLTTAISGAVSPQVNAVTNFQFIVTDDVGANSVNFSDNDGLPTLITDITISQNTNNGTNGGGDPLFDDWTNSIAGAQLSDGVNTLTASSISATTIVFSGIPIATNKLGFVADDAAKTYTLKIWLKNPVNSSLADIIDNKDFVFDISQSGITLTGVANTSSSLQASSSTSGDTNNKVKVDATKLDFTTQWLTNAGQSYDAPLSPNPIAKAHDANGNLDTDWATGGTLTTTVPATYTLANSSVTNTGGVYTFNSNLQVTSGGGGLNGGSTQLVLSSTGLTSGSSNVFILNYSGNSDVVRNTGFTHPTNINYASVGNQVTDITSGTGTTIEQFTVRDGGGASDTDGTSTVVDALTFTLQNAAYLRKIALYNNAGNEVAELDVQTSLVGSDISFTGLSTATNKIIANDNTTTDFTVKVSFLSANITDNAVININLKSVVAAGVSSSFTAGTSTTMPSLSAPTNAIAVTATQLDITTPAAASFPSLSTDFPGGGGSIVVKARDIFANVDTDFNGKITALTNATGATMINGPTLGTSAFTGGIYNFATNFQFTTGNDLDNVTLTIKADNTGGTSGTTCGTNAICSGISPTLTLKTSFESSLVGDPTFTAFSSPPAISYVNYQENANIQNTSTSYELLRALLVDGSRSSAYVYNNGSTSAPLNTNTNSGDLVADGDSDGAATTLTSITIRIERPSTIRRIALYSNGVEIPGTELDATTYNNGTGLISSSTAYYDFTWSQATGTASNPVLLTAPDDGQVPLSVRVSFRNTSPELKDQDVIKIDLVAATLGTGSKFFNGPASPANPGPYIGGQTHNGGPGTVGTIDVIATSLDFTTQPSTYAGINEPVGPTYTSSPLPSTSAGVVTARDKFTLVDLDFNYSASNISITDPAGDNIPSPAAFLNGVLNLDGMRYSLTGDGTLKVVAGGIDSNNPPGANTQAKVCNPVNVVNVTATYNGVGVLGNGTPAPATAPVSIKGGSLSQVIFGVTFTAQGATASEPTLKKFSISFDIPFSTPSRTIFSNFVVKEGSLDITSPSINGNLVISSSKGNSNMDSITVDLSAIPRSLFSAPGQSLTYYLIADVDATANISTPSITPYFSDGGYLSTSDDNIVVSQGTASGSFVGNVYSFASTKPPVLITAKNTLNPSKTSSPYNGQLNVSSSLSQIKLVFDTKVVSLDGGLNGGAELWNRNTNTKVADLLADPGSGNYISTNDYTDVINPLTLNINFLSGNSFQPDEVYYVVIKKGDFDPLSQPPAGHGISDQGLNFYGGISSNSTLYFKIASDQPLKLTAAKASIYNPSVGSLSSKFDQFGTAYFLVLPTGSPAPASYSEVKSPATYSSPALVRASGSYAITQVNVLQTHTFSASNPTLNPFVLGQTYDVYLYAENDNPVPVSSGGIYGTSLVANAGGPTIKTKFTATSYQPNYLICSNSFVTVTDPIILNESTVSSFSSGTLASPNTQDFNILLPSGYQFDLTTLPDVQLVGTDFNSTSANVTFVSNSVMKVSYKNFGSASLDYIVISNMRLTGATGSAAQTIYRFYGNNTSFASPTASLGTIGLTPNATYTFTNSYSSDNTFPSGAPAIVNAIPDNYIDLDPNIKGSIRLIPNISVVNDYNASIFSGTGVTNDLLALSAVQNNSAFNITMNHTDPNGCISEISQQYLVYDHNSPISKKLGGANSSVNLPGTAQALINPNFPNPAPASPSAQTIFNNELAGYELVSLSSNIPAAVVNNQVSQIISGSDWQFQVSKIPETPTPVVVGSIGTYYDYKWDYSHILNPLTETGANPGGTIQIDPYYGDLNHRFDAVTGNKNTYWKGGSLGNVEFTGLFRSTADLSVYVPFRQNVELFVPAVPLIEVASSNRSSYDASDATLNTISTQTAFNYINNRFGFQYTSSSGYQGTAIFCENGGIITLNGFPAALGGVSTGNFGVYDFQSYDFNEFVLKTGTITTLTSSANITGVGTSFTTELSVGARISDANGNFIGTVLTITDNLHLTLSSSAAISVVAASFKANLNQPIVTSAPNTSFVDNGNGTMTLDPSQVKNGYNDILITYTYQDNNSPAIGTGYLVIRVTPNPQPKFTIASLQAATGSPGSSSVTSFCSGSQITLDASISSIATSSQGTTNLIQKYAWDFGDPNSGPNNSSIVASATHTYTISSTYTVNLSLTSNWNCPSLPLTVTGSPMPNFVEYDGSTGTIKIGEIPAVDFSFLGNCVTDLITFTDLSSTANGANSTISKFDWDFGDNSTFTGYNQVLLPSSPDGRNVSHTYTVPNFYHVTLTTTTDLGCQRTVIKDITQLPLQTFTLNGAYNEFFDSNNGGWQALNVDNSQSPSPFVGSTSWTYSGGKWTIPATYLKNEKSALYSACLDLSSIPRPVLQFNAYVNLPSGDGLVVQYSKDSKNVQDGTKVWEVLGSTPTGPSPGLDWYNTSGLPSNPGTGYTNSKNSSGYGWSSNLNYVQPKHKLEDVTSAVGNPNSRIILRFAFSSLSDGATGNGITIDSVRVGSRTRTILFENFTTTDVGTNSALAPTVLAEMNAIASFTQANISSTQLVNLNYHVGFVGQNDPFNLDNPADPSARALYYNVTQVPYAFLDGVHSRSASGSDLFKDWGQGAYDLQTLQLARANFLDTNPTTVTLPSDGSVEVNVHFTPLIDLPYGVNKGTILGVAFLEKQITSTPSYGKVNTGETSFNYVLKKMLPSAGGTKFTQPLTANASVDAGTFKWIPQNLHSNKLTVVVFLQNELTKEVYQAELFDDIAAPGPVTAIEPLTEELVKVYPNPSDKEFMVELPQAVSERTSILMTDQLGRSIETGTFNEGEQSKTISTQGLSDGMYILQIGDKSNAVRKKILVVHK